MRYQEEITLEARNEEPDKKRRFTPLPLLKHPLKSQFLILILGAGPYHISR